MFRALDTLHAELYYDVDFHSVRITSISNTLGLHGGRYVK